MYDRLSLPAKVLAFSELKRMALSQDGDGGGSREEAARL